MFFPQSVLCLRFLIPQALLIIPHTHIHSHARTQQRRQRIASRGGSKEDSTSWGSNEWQSMWITRSEVERGTSKQVTEAGMERARRRPAGTNLTDGHTRFRYIWLLRLLLGNSKHLLTWFQCKTLLTEGNGFTGRLSDLHVFQGQTLVLIFSKTRLKQTSGKMSK